MIRVFSAYTSTIRFLVIAYQEYINVQTYSPSYVVVYVLISRLIIPYKNINIANVQCHGQVPIRDK